MTRSQLVLAALLVAAASPLAAQNVTELYVSPDTVRLEAGQRQGITVQAFDEAGNAILAVRFKVADSSVARVAGNGTVTAGRHGRTLITVQAGQKTRSVLVLVRGGTPDPAAAASVPSAPVAQPAASAGMAPPPVDVAKLVAEPARLTLLPSERASVRITALRADGSVVPAPELIWRSLQPGVAVLTDSTGTVAGIATGQGVIQVIASSGATVSVPVSVALTQFALSSDNLLLSPGDADTLRASVPALANRPLDAGNFQWSAEDPSVVDVTPGGVVRALAPGRTEVVVRGFLQERRIPVIVHQHVAHFLVAPRLTEKVRLPAQTTREFTLIPQTADSVPIEGVPITWNVADTAVAGFDPATGVLTARRPGTTTLTFAARGFVPKGWTIEVLPGSVTLSRTRFSLQPGERTTLAATFVDDQGKAVAPATGLEWVTSNAAVARVSPDGAIEAVTPGRATISARPRGGQPVQAMVLVTGDLLVSSSRGGRFGIYTLLAGQPEAFLPIVADTFANSVDAVYSPDRTRMLFASDRFGSGNFDIFVADADGRNPVRLTTDPAVDQQPVWTPDGSQVVFVSGRAGTRQLYVMKADGSEARQLTTLPGGADEPAISPDGTRVAFTGYPGQRDGQTDIYAIPLEGGQPVAVTATRDRRESNPFFFPGGELGWVQQRKDRSEPDQVLRQGGSASAPVLVSAEFSVLGVTLSRDGARMAWVASRPSERNRNALEFTLQWRTLASGAETSVRLLPGERITSPEF
jgi:uncharacterized protein YjdB